MVEEVKSPCISVCALNEEDICIGCYRSAREITVWRELTNEQKREVMQTARARLQRLNRHQLL